MSSVDVESLKFKISDKKFVENVVQELISACVNNADYFSTDNSDIGSRFYESFKKIIDLVKSSFDVVNEIEKFVGLYDFDDSTPGSGYRSFVYIHEAALLHTHRICVHIIENRESWFFRKHEYVR
jgi:hormone-sensitive lipase